MLKVVFPFLMMVRALFVSCPCCKQGTPEHPYKYQLEEKYKLPEIVDESSGIIQIGSSYFTINDSGGESVIFRLDSLFKLLDTIFLKGFKNVDWEDMAFHDPYIYIGDFGNNANKRKDLRIIKYHIPSECSETIYFSFPDQTAFPPNEKKLMNYDCEAMIWYDSSLIVFSKSKKDKQPFSAYRIPDKPGDYIAEKMIDIPLKGKVTGASYNREQNLLYILTYGKIMAYKILQEQDRINLNPVYCKKFIRAKQSEAITAEPHGNLVITNEQRNVYVFTPKKK